MILDARTREHIAALTDEALIEYIAVGVDVYQPEAVEFAREELSRRNIVPELLARHQEEALLIVNARVRAEIASEFRPLGRWGRILAFIFGWATFTPIWLVAWLRMYSRAQYQAGRDLWRFGMLGWGFWMIVIGIFAAWSGDVEDFGFSGWVMIGFGVFLVMSVLIIHGLRMERSPREGQSAFEVMPPKK